MVEQTAPHVHEESESRTPDSRHEIQQPRPGESRVLMAMTEQLSDYLVMSPDWSQRKETQMLHKVDASAPIPIQSTSPTRLKKGLLKHHSDSLDATYHSFSRHSKVHPAIKN